MSTLKCPHCADGVMSEVVYSKPVRQGRRSVQVEGLKKYLCATCQGDLVSRAQMKANDTRIDEALAHAVEASVDAVMLKGLREQFDLTQKQASRLFCAGDSAFAKWESGQTALSGPATLLVRCALEVRGVMEHLASLQGVRLSIQPQPAVQQDFDEVQWESALSIASPVLTSASTLGGGPKSSSAAAEHKSGLEALEIDDEGEWQQASNLQSHHANQPRSIARLFH
jgi:putative zinc finger/helix-turn-helix YgiT family protein